ncbi:DUF413 domain-containing protein [Thalassotalea profundi]|uniref:Macrodomain Ori protein n=1 Tax=Thalassotalea profundi TaxID=2036687 RepID=A0ABQ3IJ85_9GAMM|nr:DUF413 domain-containing protein [Thalassotalea profundi]GHE83383.1 hypothetical protein GCM10011501_09820 [Thalassotalea profundi]
MDTTIRIGSRLFLGDITFSHGISRSGYFNKRESHDLEMYGLTLEGLYSGVLTATNEEEQQFVEQVMQDEESSLYPVKLWKKYLAAVQKSKRRHGFMASESKSSAPAPAIAEVEMDDF